MRKGSGSYSLPVLQLDHKPVSLGQSSRGLHKHGEEKCACRHFNSGVSGSPEHICCGHHGELQQKLVPKHEKRGQRCTAPCRAASLLLTHAATAYQSRKFNFSQQCTSHFERCLKRSINGSQKLTVKLQTPVHTHSTKYAFRSILFSLYMMQYCWEIRCK